jgi:ubiquinone/menaquinone biosynthesis C-methylase UbiE
MHKSGEATEDALAGIRIHEQWVATYRTAEAQAFYEMAFDEIVRRLNPPPDATILDAGCGSCAKSVLLAKRGFKVVAADFSASALDLAADTIRTHGLDGRITLRQGDLLKLPFGDGEFRYALCWGVLMHVPQVELALAELARVLAPGGMLVLSEGNLHSFQSGAISVARRLLRRPARGRDVRARVGVESIEETPQGTLLTRQTDVAAFTAFAATLDLRLAARIPGQFTEMYAVAPWRPAKQLIHGINRLWFRYVGLAGPAFANILFFEKRLSA